MMSGAAGDVRLGEDKEKIAVMSETGTWTANARCVAGLILIAIESTLSWWHASAHVVLMCGRCAFA